MTRTTRDNTPQIPPLFSRFYVRTPKKEVQTGVRTFYVPSEVIGTPEYTVKHTWRGKNSNALSWVCSCPDWLHRKGPLGQPCKHIRVLKLFVESVGGFSAIPYGTTIEGRRDKE